MNSTTVPAPAAIVAAPSSGENVGHSRRHIDERAGAAGGTGAVSAVSDTDEAGAAGAACTTGESNSVLAKSMDAAQIG
jgi:hypothetical protein